MPIGWQQFNHNQVRQHPQQQWYYGAINNRMSQQNTRRDGHRVPENAHMLPQDHNADDEMPIEECYYQPPFYGHHPQPIHHPAGPAKIAAQVFYYPISPHYYHQYPMQAQ